MEGTSLLELWTSETSATSVPTSLPPTPSAISSLASADGPTPSTSPDGPATAPCGPAPARANLSARQAAEAGQLTSGTCGPRSSTSSTSADLQRCLESRLRARMASLGSTLFTLTWKVRVTPLGRPICALRASVPRTSDSGCGSWPTTRAKDGVTGMHQAFTDTRERGTDLATVAGWATPQANDSEKRGQPAMIPGAQTCLPVQVIGATWDRWGTNAHAAWPTACATDWKGPNPLERPIGDDDLPTRMARLAPWATPTVGNAMGSQAAKGASLSGRREDGSKATVSLNMQACATLGATSNGSPAATEKPGQLNPEFSLWLMGYPNAWARCAAQVTRSSRRSRPSSSKRT